MGLVAAGTLPSRWILDGVGGRGAGRSPSPSSSCPPPAPPTGSTIPAPRSLSRDIRTVTGDEYRGGRPAGGSASLEGSPPAPRYSAMGSSFGGGTASTTPRASSQRSDDLLRRVVAGSGRDPAGRVAAENVPELAAGPGRAFFGMTPATSSPGVPATRSPPPSFCGVRTTGCRRTAGAVHGRVPRPRRRRPVHLAGADRAGAGRRAPPGRRRASARRSTAVLHLAWTERARAQAGVGGVSAGGSAPISTSSRKHPGL